MTLDEKRRMVEAVTRKLLSKIGPDIDTLKAAGIGVTIFAFTFDAGALAYISTAERAGMIRSIEEWLACQRAGLTTDPHGERGTT